MRAWELNEINNDLHLVNVPDPEVRAGAAVIDVLAVQIPAYTSVITTGLRGSVPTPLILGTGGVGRVSAVAEDVFGLQTGDVVLNAGLLRSGDVADPQEFLLSWTGIGGRGERTADIARMQALWRDGTFAERALLPAQVLIRLPGAENYPRPEQLGLLSWLSIAAEGLVRGEQQPGDVVAVLGATGQLGAAAVLLALARGASRVVAVGRNRFALDRLAALDARVAIVALSGDRAQDAAAIRAAGEPGLVLDTFGATDSAEPTLTGFDSLRPGGTLVLVGGVRHDLALPYGHVMRRRLSVRGSWMARPETAAAVWRLVQSGAVDLNQATVRTVGLDDPAAALDLAAASGGLDFVVLRPDATRL